MRPNPLRKRPRTLAAVLALSIVGGCQSGGTPPQPGPDLPPRPAEVRDGLGPDQEHHGSVQSVFANWDPFVDPEGRAVTYYWAVGTRPGADDVVAWRCVAGNTAADALELAIPSGTRVFSTVRAVDPAGHMVVASSNGMLVVDPRATPLPVAQTPPRDPTPQPVPPVTAPVTAPVIAAAGRHVFAISHGGVTWRFQDEVLAGTFANGDPWVIAPAAIASIDPPCQVADGRVRNGSMLDPDPTTPAQGYDSTMYGGPEASHFAPQLNVAAGIGPERPLRLRAGQSLVSSISDEAAGQLPQLRACAVLTCLAEPPPPDGFRPPYCKGADKRVRFTTGRLDLTRLGRLAPVPGTPDPADLAARFARVWLDHAPGWLGRYLHPQEHMPDYGREMADLVGQAAVVLQTDLPDAQKLPLLVGLVQFGIDSHGILTAGGAFAAEGGDGAGRKLPILLAGAVLGDPDLLAAARTPGAFAEDRQTFYVVADAGGRWNGGHGGYVATDEGMPEWGPDHFAAPERDQKEWTADPFRRCCTANAWVGSVLAARIMGLREAWGHPPLFDYLDRYVAAEPRDSWTRCWSRWLETAWDAWRPHH